MTSLIRRLCVIGPCLLLGASGVGVYAVLGCPSGWGWNNRLEAWAYMLTGPALLAILGGGPVPDVVGYAFCLGWLGLFAMAAHPLRPTSLTALLTALGCFFWFASGIVTLIMCLWGA